MKPNLPFPSPGRPLRAARSNRIPAFTAAFLIVLLPSALEARDGEHDHHDHGFTHAITTASPEAQQQFDRGLQLAWGFNHLEAARAFRKATELDPACAMCWWGRALVLGPNINAPLDAKYYPEILESLGKAKALAPKATEAERAYIKALAERYPPEPVEDRSKFDKAYADAMRRVARRYPADLTAATLFAEALMDTSPWDYWLPNGEPKTATREFIDVLETVLRREPRHPGGSHLLIHAVEKGRPAEGVPAAERLDADPQATGHLVHMASHIYMRVGRYEDAARVNQRAIEDDDAYAAKNQVPDEYFPYMMHNHHMRWAALGFEGRREESRYEARYLRQHIPEELLRVPAVAAVQIFWPVPLYDQIWFGEWDAILAEQEPAADLKYPLAMWNYARGVAQARKGAADAAAANLEKLASLTEEVRALTDGYAWGLNHSSALLDVAKEVLAGEIAAARGDHATAIRHLQEAVRREDALVYEEPPPWLYPSRQALARIQLAAGKAGDAEATYREDLDIYPRNGWALMGLAKSLEAQEKSDEAAKVRADLNDAWARTEVKVAEM
jgi:tetratricopeptide (TPR) repeat protein